MPDIGSYTAAEYGKAMDEVAYRFRNRAIAGLAGGIIFLICAATFAQGAFWPLFVLAAAALVFGGWHAFRYAYVTGDSGGKPIPSVLARITKNRGAGLE